MCNFIAIILREKILSSEIKSSMYNHARKGFIGENISLITLLAR